MNFLKRLFGGKEHGVAPSAKVEGDWIVVRMRAPEIDASTLQVEPHEGHVHVTASSAQPDGTRIQFSETVNITGVDTSQAQVAKEGDEVVIRIPRS